MRGLLEIVGNLFALESVRYASLANSFDNRARAFEFAHTSCKYVLACFLAQKSVAMVGPKLTT